MKRSLILANFIALFISEAIIVFGGAFIAHKYKDNFDQFDVVFFSFGAIVIMVLIVFMIVTTLMTRKAETKNKTK